MQRTPPEFKFPQKNNEHQTQRSLIEFAAETQSSSPKTAGSGPIPILSSPLPQPACDKFFERRVNALRNAIKAESEARLPTSSQETQASSSLTEEGVTDMSKQARQSASPVAAEDTKEEASDMTKQAPQSASPVAAEEEDDDLIFPMDDIPKERGPGI
ncbi:hypothetical protein [Legionella impletisoli]|uniref:Uncharacterized protein n=1 Tax=Legionella impletisoli TaxID=343510 RepID=A0A917JV68_9GAMM|nr:hypothetical protein [Legionella impletisoli]GGI87554.1 hypothetical protein GCM10007966_15380 [Legionella impletisoli]